MVNPISSSQNVQSSEAVKTPTLTNKPQTQSAALPSDTVTLKSTGDVNHDGDSK